MSHSNKVLLFQIFHKVWSDLTSIDHDPYLRITINDLLRKGNEVNRNIVVAPKSNNLLAVYYEQAKFHLLSVFTAFRYVQDLSSFFFILFTNH